MLPEELLGKYSILQLIHHGIGGDIWLAEHTRLAGKRVLKAINKSHPAYDTLIEEAKILQQCRHASIPIIYDILEFDTQTYIVEEFIEGDTLKQYILKMRSLSDSLLLDFSTQLCEILQFLHNPARPVLYLDLKPENILIANHSLKLIDFGSAIYRNRQNGTRFIFGTPRYCAPEQRRAEFLTEETDIYCLGKCMEYMLMFTKHPPKGYQRIVNCCLRKEDRRYTSVKEVWQDLQKLGTGRRKEKRKEQWVAVMGVLAETDSTVAAIQLAAFLRDRYKKAVLYLDCSTERWVERLEQGQCREEECHGFVFEQNGITIAKRVAPQEILAWHGRGYSYIVCDFGKKCPYLAENPFLACLCAGPVSEMNLPEWERQLSLLGRYCPLIVAVTGGDVWLAKNTLDRYGHVGSLYPFYSMFVISKKVSRQIKYLLTGCNKLLL